MDNDNVNHPDHYNWHPVAECKDIIKWFPWPIGEAIKYLWRAGRKNNAIEDLEKAKMCIDFAIEKIKEEGQ